MTCDRQWSECAEVASIFECNEAEWDNDQKNSLFVDVPAKEEGGISAESDSSDKRFPVRTQPEFNQRELCMLVSN